ncbi:MAG: addiction module protein [Gammaproteobacteria bacterium]|nr:addiction module protein [Gammaproteobacteria bacterium]
MNTRNLFEELKQGLLESKEHDITILSVNENSNDCPQWHQQALKETEQRFKEGKEELIDWKRAKQLLRKEFE